jgi:hypothetical protein
MSIRKIDDDDEKWRNEVCRHPEHNPPTHICLPPGKYEHTCPGCKSKVVFVVPQHYWLDSGGFGGIFND